MSAEAIARLRAQFEVELTKNPDLYHPIDIERVRTEDWQVKRYLLEAEKTNGNEEESSAFQALLKTLQWKKSFGLHDRTDQDFPLEIWAMTGSEIIGRDRAGNLVAWEAARDQRSFKETALLMRQFVVHFMEKADRLSFLENQKNKETETEEKGVVFVGDTAGSSVWNIDSSLEQFKIEILEHYPGVLRALYIVDVSWLINAIVKLIISFMSPQLKALVRFVSAAQLAEEYIDPEVIPISIKGGQRKESGRPGDLLRLEQMAEKLGLEAKFVDHFYKTTKFPRGSGGD